MPQDEILNMMKDQLGLPIMKPVSSWEDEFRQYFDQNLKSKKAGIKNLDMEIILSRIKSLLFDQKEKIVETIKAVDYKNRRRTKGHYRSVIIQQIKNS